MNKENKNRELGMIRKVIRNRREELHITRKELSELSCVSAMSIQRIELNMAATNVDILISVVKALGGRIKIEFPPVDPAPWRTKKKPGKPA